MEDKDAAAPPSALSGVDPARAHADPPQPDSREPIPAAGSRRVGPEAGTGSGPGLEQPASGAGPVPSSVLAPSKTGPSREPSANLRSPRFVAPSSYLRFKTSHGSGAAMTAPATTPESPLDKEQRQGLVHILSPAC